MPQPSGTASGPWGDMQVLVSLTETALAWEVQMLRMPFVIDERIIFLNQRLF